MQAVKKIAATVKQKVGNASAEVEEKKEDTKFVAEEKVNMARSHGDEAAKNELAAKKNEREAEAEQHKEATKAQHADEKERVVNPHPGPMGDKTTPADLDRIMGVDNPDNPANPEFASGPSAPASSVASGPTIPMYLAPSSGGEVA